MTDSVAYQAAQVLDGKGVGKISPSAGDWRIYVGQMLDDQDNILSFYDAPGQSPENRLLLDFPFFQVIVRGNKNDYNGAYSKAHDVKDVFLGIDPFDVAGVGSDHWSGCTMNGDVGFVSYDKNSRPLFSLNFRVLMERAPSGLTNRVSL